MNTTTPSPTTVSKYRGLAWLAAIVAMIYLFDRCTAPVDDLEAAGKQIVVAVEAFNAKNGRYPMSLDELVPKYLPELPKAGKYFVIDYAVSPDGKQCWVAYQVHRDRIEEYDCRKRGWENMEFMDSASRNQPNVKRQRIESEPTVAAKRAAEKR
jgi:hypothetical protein